MAERKISASFQQRRDTAANWEKKNPILLDGEPITVVTNSGAVRHKTGDGTKTYKQLPFDDEPLYNALAGKCDASQSIDVTLLASGWTNGEQTVSVSGVTAKQNGIAGLPQSFSDAEYEAIAAAELYVAAQTDGSVTFACNGDVPQIDVPAVIILLG